MDDGMYGEQEEKVFDGRCGNSEPRWGRHHPICYSEGVVTARATIVRVFPLGMIGRGAASLLDSGQDQNERC